ncbi:MAG: MBOAT family protein [Myxococcales bacterium]|nr:MBOAT family protein [Myxococcales bacterium]
MIFNSIEFAIFFVLIGSAFFLLTSRWRWLLLLIASYAFYMRWNASYAVLIALSTVIDFFAGRVIASAESPARRKAALLTSLATNLGILFTFKYWHFFHATMDDLAAVVGVPYSVPDLDFLLPVGISFYTFQTLSYTIDIYRGTLKPEPHFGIFALYVSYFPQLVAGPIERASRLLPQLRQPVVFDYGRVTSGLQLMLWGMFKKVVVGDRLGLYVDAVYNNSDAHSSPTLWLATYAFAFQIYCDFSGYSDIAIGTSRVLGYDLMRNFERPYFSQTITEFWRRWHISLSTWLRDYLYISLGGNRLGTLMTYRNLMITMLLGGLWHGASWNFIIWGALQGLFLMTSRASLPRRNAFAKRLGIPPMVLRIWRTFVTFHLVCLSWVFFRAGTLDQALSILSRALQFTGSLMMSPQTMAHGVLGVAALLLVEVAVERYPAIGERFRMAPTPLRWAGYYALIAAVVLAGVEGSSQFIYFQF